MILKVVDALKSFRRTYPDNEVRRDQRKVNVLDFKSRRPVLLILFMNGLSS